MSKSSPGKYKKFIRDGKDYLNTRYDLLRLELLEKISSIVALLILVMIGLVLLASVWVYISGIFIVLMHQHFDSLIPPFIIMGGASFLLLIIIILLKEWIIINPLVNRFSKIMFDNGDDEDEDDEDEIIEEKNDGKE